MEPTKLLIKKYDRAFYTSVEWYLEKQGYHNIGMGGYRKVFHGSHNANSRHIRCVIKVPKEQDGLEHNIREAYAYRKYRNRPDILGIFYAPCRLLANGCLLMSYVTYVPYTELPSWCRYIDGYQAGKFKDRFVAFDGGCDIPDQDRTEALEWAGVEG